MIADLKKGRESAAIAATFHHSLAYALSDMVDRLQLEYYGQFDSVALGGGVFQNRLLLEGFTKALEAMAMNVLSPSLVPANDGGIALGQTAVALARLEVS